MKIFNRIMFVLFFLFLFSNQAFAEKQISIPDQLTPWVDWVLHGHEEEYLCSPAFNNAKKLQCDWPLQLDLVIEEKVGTFSQQWLVQHERWIQLPGDEKHWPEDVKLNGKPFLVMNRGGLPKIKVRKGKHDITGRFSWLTIPRHLIIPNHTGIVSLFLRGKKIDFPNFDPNGQLWLQATKQNEKKIENRLNLESYRLIDDQIPPRVVLSLKLDVAGTARELVLGPVFSPEKFIPVSIASSLPAKLEPDGRLRIQVRPGQWYINIESRHIGPIASFAFNPPDDGFWPQQEVVVFSAKPSLRSVEIAGVSSIDPLQTSLPDNWRNLPAYRLLTGDTMLFKEIRRGDPQPAPDQLSLQRNMYLRFDGSGFTIQDVIQGSKKTNWRLEMNPPVMLGRVAIDGHEQFITKREDSDKSGVELRKGLLNMVADSQYLGNISKISATGWDHNFQKVKASLHLPPGWKLLNATGIDNIPYTWVKLWTLLDFFIVLIFTIAVANLYSRSLATIAFMSLVLIYHEPNAPRWIWLAILIGVALIRYLPEGKFKQGVKIYKLITILILIVISIPFAVSQLRIGIYPQLEKPYMSMMNISGRQAAAPPPAESVQEQFKGDSTVLEKGSRLVQKMEDKVTSLPMRKKVLEGESYYSPRSQVAQFDPKMIQQTGPGLPNWQWNHIPMSWSGPVHSDQQISFLFIGPKTNLTLSFVRVVLITLLALGLLGFKYQKGKGFQYPKFKPLLMVPFLMFYFCFPSPGQASEIPSPEMFKELKQRLLETDDCFPHCADISQMSIEITPENLNIIMAVDTQIEVSVPLPGNAKHWLPQQVLVDGKPVSGLFRVNNVLWVLMPSGKHEIAMKGRIPKQNTLQLPLPLKPHKITTKEEGWTVQGLHDGYADNQLQFKRAVKEKDLHNQILETGILPPFVLVERTLLLGLNWKVATKIQRISPTGSAIVFSVPLLQGESIVTDGIQVKDGTAQINLDAGKTQVFWESFLEKTDQVLLKHADTDLYTEIWKVDISPIFHMETEGIPVILHQQGNRWFPTWHPWPNEEVKLKLTRPAGIKGQTITIDKSHLTIRPGRRATDTKLDLSMRSSQGGQHTFVIPAGATLQSVSINGQVQPIRQEGKIVTLPVRPGPQDISMQWREASGMTSFFKTADVDLGIKSVNSHIELHLPRSQWPLFMGGPLLGPAVLFWSVILIVVLVAFGLSRTNLTPLKFHHWLLLGIGMSMSNLAGCLVIVGWLLALDYRGKLKPDIDNRKFNGIQVGLGILTLIALGVLINAISQGLLGHPDMNIIGNGSSSGVLRWYQDHNDHHLPSAWVVSIPMIVYRFAMLAWALWISFTLIGLLRWGWNNFSTPTIWHNVSIRPQKATTTSEDRNTTLIEKE